MEVVEGHAGFRIDRKRSPFRCQVVFFRLTLFKTYTNKLRTYNFFLLLILLHAQVCRKKLNESAKTLYVPCPAYKKMLRTFSLNTCDQGARQ